MDGCVWRMFFLISFGLVQRWVWLTAWKQQKSLTGWLSLFLGHLWRVLLHLSENIQSDRPSLTRATWCVLSNAACMCWDSYFMLFRLESLRWLCVFLMLWSWAMGFSRKYVGARSMDGCVWRMCFSWARTMLSLADCVEAMKELDRMIVTFLRTPLESASASQWEYTKWPPQSDESYVMCAFQCRVHVLGRLFRVESLRWLCVFLSLWSWARGSWKYVGA